MMKKVFALALSLVSFAYIDAQTNRYDVNLDSNVDVNDVTALVDYILRNTAYDSQYDVFEDGSVNVSDVTDLVDYILGKHHGDNQRHAAIDLGLASGTLWAACNVGAPTPPEYGDYYSWGEIEHKNDYSKRAYEFYVNAAYQEIGADISSTEYDVAHIQWGGTWHMPTKTQAEELLTSCTWTPTTINSIHGYIVTGPNGNTIFLPSAGRCSGTTGATYAGTNGYYWTSTATPLASSAYSMYTEDYEESWYANRAYGMTIRPVR